MSKVSSAVDNRIVELSFDNRDFESKMQTTLKSLDTFDKSLDNIDGKSLEKITEAASKVDLSGITSAALAVKNSFSAMEIVTMTVIQNITNALIRFGKNLWSNTFGQIKSGGMKRALNIEQATFLLEGLGLEVQKIKDDAMYAVEGTAYGFDEAAKAAAAFGASGVKAGDDMKQALLGVSGVAAMTGSDYARMADIFTTVASNGKLMTMQLRQFATYGLNVSAVLGQQLGKTENQINELVRKGEIDFKTFAKAMNDAFGKHAKDANKTFTGSLANMKAALSRIGEAFATPFINNAIPVFNTLKDLFNKVKSDLSPFINDFKLISKIVSVLLTNSINKLKDSGKIEKIFATFRNVITTVALVLDRIKKAFKEVFPNIKDFTDLFYKLSVALIPSEKTLMGLEQIFKGLFTTFKVAVVVFRDISKFVLSLTMYFGNLGVQLIQSAYSLKQFIDPFLKWVNQTRFIENTLYALIGGFVELKNKLSDLVISFVDWILHNDDLITFAKSVYETVTSIAMSFVALISSVNSTTVVFVTFAVVLVFVGEIFRQIFITGIQTFTSFIFKLYRLVTNITSIFSNLAKIVAEVKHVLQYTVFEIMANVLLKIAVSIAILTISLTALSKIKVENILKAGFTLAALAGILIGVYAAFEAVTKANTLNEIAQAALLSLALFGLSSAFIALALSMKILASLGWDGLAIAFIGMATIVTAFCIISKNALGINSKGFYTMSQAVLTLSIAMSILTAIGKGDKIAMGMAIVSIMSLMYAMIDISKASKNFDLKGIKPDGFKKFADTIFSLALSMSILTAIGSKDKTAMAIALGSIITMMAIVIYMAKMSKGMMLVNTKAYIDFAQSLLILSIAMAILIQIGKQDHTAMWIALGCILGLVAIIEVKRILDKKLATSMASDLTILGLKRFCKSLLTMAVAMSILTYFTRKDKAAAFIALGIIIVLSLLLTAMQEISAKLAKKYGNDNVRIFQLGMKGFAKALLTLAVAMSILTYFTRKDKAAALVALGSVLLLGVLMGAMLELCKKYEMAEIYHYNSLMRAFSASVFVLSIAMSILAKTFNGGNNDYNTLLKVAFAFGIILTVFKIMYKISENANRMKTEGMFRMASSMMILAASMMIISLLPISKMLAAAGAISVMAIALGFAGRLMKDAASIKTLFMFPLMAVGVVLLASAILMLQDISWERMLVAAGVLALLSLAIMGMTKLAKDIKLLNTVGFIALSISLIALAFGLQVLSEIPIKNLIAASVAMVVLAAAIVGLGAVSGIELVSKGLGILSIALATFGFVALSVGAGIALVLQRFNELVITFLSLKDVSTDTMNTVVANMRILFQGIKDTAPLMADAIGTVVKSACNAIIDSLPLIIGVIALIGLGIKYQTALGLLALLPLILDVLYEMLMAVNKWAEEHDGDLYNVGYNIGYRLVKGMLAALEGGAYAIVENLEENVLPSFGIKTEIMKTKESAQKIADDWKEHFYNRLKEEDGRSEESARYIIEGLNNGIKAGYISYEEACAKLAEVGLESFKNKLDIHSPSGEMEEAGENTVLGLIKGIFNGEVKFQDVMSELAEKGAQAFKDKMGSFNFFDLAGFDLSSITGYGQKSAYDLIEDPEISKQSHGQATGLNHRWKVEGYDSAEAWEAQNKQLDPLTSLLEEYASQLGIDTSALEDMTDATNGLTDATKGLSDSTDSYLIKAAKQYGKFRTEFSDSIRDALKNVYDEVSESDPIGTDEMLHRMEENTRKVGQWARQLRELAARGMSEGLLNELKEMGPQAADKVDAFARMSAEQLEKANLLWTSKFNLPEYATDELVKSYEEAGYNASLGFWEGLDHEQVKAAFYQLGEEGLNELERSLEIESPSKKTKKDGLYASMGLAEGLSNVFSIGLVKTAIGKLVDTILNTLYSKLNPSTATKISKDFISGLSNGFTGSESIRSITEKVNNIANSVTNKLRSSWDEHSPSKKAEELGLFFMKGLGIGLDNGASYLESQTGETADDIFNSMKDQLYGSLANFTEDGVYQPVIRPVFDLTSLDEGLNYINSWFAEGHTISLAGNIQRLTPTTKENDDILNREILDAIRNIDVNGVRNELNGIRTDISELQTAVTNLQVVMDTGALVGQLVNPMDSALGAKALMNGRGRY